MVTFEMNIGLLIGEPDDIFHNTWADIKRRADKLQAILTGATVYRLSVTSEPTLVVEMTANDSAAACELAYDVAKWFEQDCVAIYFPGKRGYLLGPGAYKWGSFDLAYFERA